jgi:hypothetical protein
MEFFKGIAGFFLYLGTLVAPTSESNLSVKTLYSDDAQYYRIRTVFEFNWDENSTEIVNSGISIVVKYSCKAGRKKQELYRILRKPVFQKDYFVIDSLPDGQTISKSFPNIPLALRNFKQIEWLVSVSVKKLDFSAEIENSFVPSMDLYVDISPIFGGKRFDRKVNIEEFQ